MSDSRLIIEDAVPNEYIYAHDYDYDYDLYDDLNTCEENIGLLTNFEKSIRPIYEKAIELYIIEKPNTDLYIRDNAYWTNGLFDSSLNALMTHESDMSRF